MRKLPSPHFTVVFDTVETNIGNGYNQYTGAFVVPVAGTYVFSFSITCWDHSRVGVDLMCNNDAIGSTTADSELIQDVHVGATTVVVILNKEDTCFLRTGTRLHSLGTLHSDYWSRSSFSGKFKALFCHFYNKIQIKFVCFFFKFSIILLIFD